MLALSPIILDCTKLTMYLLDLGYDPPTVVSIAQTERYQTGNARASGPKGSATSNPYHSIHDSNIRIHTSSSGYTSNHSHLHEDHKRWGPGGSGASGLSSAPAAAGALSTGNPKEFAVIFTFSYALERVGRGGKHHGDVGVRFYIS